MPISPYITRQGEPFQQHVHVASDDGAIPNDISGVVVITKATAAALTLADPSVRDDGLVLTIASTTAAAHTVDNSAGSGFNGAGAGSDVGTFGAAIGNGFSVYAYGGAWYVVPGSNLNVTLA